MSSLLKSAPVSAVTALILATVARTHAADLWTVSTGSVRFAIDGRTSVIDVEHRIGGASASALVDDPGTLVLTGDHGAVRTPSGYVTLTSPVEMIVGSRVTVQADRVWFRPSAGSDQPSVTIAANDVDLLELQDVRIALDVPGRTFLVESGELRAAPALQAFLDSAAVDDLTGSFTMAASIAWAGGSLPSPIEPQVGSVAGGETAGPDVMVGELHNLNSYGTFNGFAVYSVGTTSCNRGDTPLSWVAETNQHPVIGQNMYRLKDGRFEQIGQSWLKHGFLALAENACGLGCQNPNNGALLGVGCSDPYSANLNGSQGNLGMKSEVNAHTGFFPYPPSNPAWSGPVDRRLRARVADVDPAQDGGGLYFVEGQYVASDDAALGNNNNNASYRRVTIALGGGTWNMAFAAPTQREQAAIRAWKDNDPAVVETDIQVPGDGLLILAAKATHLGDGVWHYEYAVQNLNCDRGVGSFVVPMPPAMTAGNAGFHDVDYHSGEPYSGADWALVSDPAGMRWETDSASTNPNANALRWGTLYNFRFDAPVVPVMTEVTIGLFKPGAPQTVTAMTIAPATAPTDCNANGLLDVCDIDCNAMGGECNVPGCGLSVDCDHSGQVDECEIDCNDNGIFDSCDLADGTSADCNTNSVPDECDANWDGDAAPDACDPDIDNDGVLNAMDVCDFTPLGASIRPNGAVVGDTNGDCDVDLTDHNHFDECLLQSGPNDPPTAAGCLNIYDYEHDGDVDLRDFAGIANVFTGSGG